MRHKLSFAFLVFPLFLAHAQQYGWVQVAQLDNRPLQAVEFVDSLRGWSAEGTDRMYKTTDGGSNWNFYGTTGGFVVNSISMLDTLTGWAAGSQSESTGKIMRTTNGGIGWTLQLVSNSRSYVGTATTSLFKNITSGYTRIPGVPDSGKLVQTTDGGTTWTERTIADSIGFLGKMQFIDSLYGWIIAGVYGHPGAILRTVDGGANWTVHFPPRGFAAISFIDTSRGWGITPGIARLYRTTNGGATWEFQYVFDPPDPHDRLEPLALSFTDSLNGWAFGWVIFQGYFAGGILHTTDGGNSWFREFREEAGRLIQINDALMLGTHHGWAVGDGGVVLAYRPITSVAEKLDQIPKSFSLRQNYPNPFNSTTSIEYEVVERSAVAITVYDVNGKEVRRLVHAESEPGVFRIRFDAAGLASGVYYCTMKTDTGTKLFLDTKQMVLLK